MMKSVNVIVSGRIEATIPMESWVGLDDVKNDWAGVDGAELRPASGKVFGKARHHIRGYVRRNNRWWTF